MIQYFEVNFTARVVLMTIGGNLKRNCISRIFASLFTVFVFLVSAQFYCGSDLKLIFGFGWKVDTMTVIYY